MTWDVPTWNEGGSDRLVMAIEYDEDTEMDVWCWRVGRSGVVIAEGRAMTRADAISRCVLAVETAGE